MTSKGKSKANTDTQREREGAICPVTEPPDVLPRAPNATRSSTHTTRCRGHRSDSYHQHAQSTRGGRRLPNSIPLHTSISPTTPALVPRPRHSARSGSIFILPALLSLTASLLCTRRPGNNTHNVTSHSPAHLLQHRWIWFLHPIVCNKARGSTVAAPLSILRTLHTQRTQSNPPLVARSTLRCPPSSPPPPKSRPAIPADRNDVPRFCQPPARLGPRVLTGLHSHLARVHLPAHTNRHTYIYAGIMAGRDKDWDDANGTKDGGSPDPETLYTKEYCIGASHASFPFLASGAWWLARTPQREREKERERETGGYASPSAGVLG